MWQYNNLDELYHYGILGMHWGRRNKRPVSEDYSRVKDLKKNKIKQLSNNELREVNNRMSLENNYKSYSPSLVKKGLFALGTTAGVLGSIVAIKGAAPQVRDLSKNLISKMRNLKIPIRS